MLIDKHRDVHEYTLKFPTIFLEILFLHVHIIHKIISEVMLGMHTYATLHAFSAIILLEDFPK